MKENKNHRLAVISGAGSGIGLACAQRLASEGFDILMLDLANKAEHAAVTIKGAGQIFFANADVTDRSQIDQALSQHEVVDVIVHSAGRFWTKSIDTIQPEDFRSMFDINAIGAANLVQASLNRMPFNSRIINIASRAFLGSANRAHYVAAKAAMIGLTRAMAIDLSERGILVNAVAPGLVRTDLFSDITQEEFVKLARQYPGGRIAEAEDIAHIVAFLADSRTKFINGQVLIADAGRSAGIHDTWAEN